MTNKSEAIVAIDICGIDMNAMLSDMEPIRSIMRLHGYKRVTLVLFGSQVLMAQDIGLRSRPKVKKLPANYAGTDIRSVVEYAEISGRESLPMFIVTDVHTASGFEAPENYVLVVDDSGFPEFSFEADISLSRVLKNWDSIFSFKDDKLTRVDRVELEKNRKEDKRKNVMVVVDNAARFATPQNLYMALMELCEGLDYKALIEVRNKLENNEGLRKKLWDRF